MEFMNFKGGLNRIRNRDMVLEMNKKERKKKVQHNLEKEYNESLILNNDINKKEEKEEYNFIDYNSGYGKEHNYTYELGNGSRKIFKSEPWKIDEW